MKSKNPYTFFNQFCLRTPLLPLDFYFDLTKEQKISIEKYQELWGNEIIREAIFLASPSLFSIIEKWLSGKIKDPKKAQKLEYALFKYLSRMSSRCTPFGLFAGCSMGAFTDTSEIRMDSSNVYERQTRFDMNFLVALSQKLSKETHIKKQLLWYPNTSLYKIGQQYRYIEYQYGPNNKRLHSIEAITHTPYLEIILAQASSGKKIRQLALSLVDDEISIEDAEAFMEELIANQVLVSSIEPSITGNDFLTQLVESLKKIKGTQEVVNEMEQYLKFLDQIDQKLGNSAQEYIDVSKSIKKLEVAFDLKFLFQTDVYPKTIVNQLNNRIGYQIKRAMTVLNKISMPPQNTRLQQFKKAFLKRYETREISLATALDTEIGVGYIQEQGDTVSTPFLDDLDIPFQQGVRQNHTWSEIQEILYQALQKSKEKNRYTLLLEDVTIENLEVNWADLPDTMSAMAEIVTIDAEEKIILSAVSGSSAASLLGRFTIGNSQILQHCSTIADMEQKMHPEKILAEIIHLPESRTGNILRREVIRDYEIPYLGNSNLPKEDQIPIHDLMISIQHNRIVLRSKKHNKEVIPKLSNAHNYSGMNSLPVYHFLCDLPTQNKRRGIAFNWGELLEKNNFLPRVIYKNFIFSKARWRITKKEIEPLLYHIEHTKNLMTEIVLWRSKLQMPLYVQLIDGDNTLLVNMNHSISVGMLLHSVKNRDQFVLEEFLGTEIEEGLVKNKKQTYVNQFVFSFYNEEKLKVSKNTN